jgi:signal peptidase II
MPKLNWGNYRWLWISGLVLLADQVSKYYALAHLVPFQSIPVLPFFDITLVFNTGAAFSLLAKATGWQNIFLLIVAVIISLVILVWLLRATERPRLPLIGLAMVLGGALGNIGDRLQHGFVIDFLDFYIGVHHWPVFNLADSAITIGVGLLALQMARDYLDVRSSRRRHRQ